MSAPPAPEPSARAILTALGDLVSAREEEAHDALQVGGYLPLDPDFPVEIPLALCYAAREVLRRHAAGGPTAGKDPAEPHRTAESVHNSPRIATIAETGHRIG